MAGKRRGVTPPAEQRTVGLFTGKTDLELAAAAQEDVKDDVKVREPITLETIERDLKRWETDGWHKMNGYQLARLDNGHYVLQRIGYGGYTYNGMVIRKEDLIPLAKQMVLAAKELLK